MRALSTTETLPRRAWRRRALVALAGALLFPAAGCLDYDELLTLERDGSGHMAIDLTLDLSFMTELKKLDPTPEGEDSGDLKSLVTKEEIQKDCDVPGVTVTTCQVEDKGDKKTHLKLAFDFRDLDALRAVRFFSDRELALADKGDDLELTYRYNARSILNMLGLDPTGPEPSNEHDRKVKQILEDARKAARARFEIAAPGALVATNGAKEDEKTARWTIDRSDPKAQDQLLREPLSMQVTVAKKDAPGLAKELEKKKSDGAPGEKPDASPGKPGGNLGGD